MQRSGGAEERRSRGEKGKRRRADHGFSEMT
jgi:hypothetical protein